MVRAVVIAVVCLGGVASAQQPSERQEAADHFKKAKTAERAGRHQEAIDEYLLAYTLVPHADVLFNIGFNYEALEQWARAIEYYQRYLDERDDRPSDADAVLAKIDTLKRKLPPPPPAPAPAPSPVRTAAQPEEPPRVGIQLPPPPPPDPLARWHAGGALGLAVGDVPVERYLLHGGVQLGRRVDVDAILGKLGKNDYALGVLVRLMFTRSEVAQPFARAAATIGIAKQDSSPSAGTRSPLGLELGGGLQLGARGRVELDAVVRWTRGGWDAESTVVDSYVNDAFAFAFDVGFVIDFSIISGVRR